jgi:LacI family transcriptional regulator
MPTIFDVAKAANVSIASVSLVLSDPGTSRVGPAKRDRILALAREMGYRPSLLARGLGKHGTGILGLVVPASDPKVFFNMTISEILAGIQACLAEQGRHLMVYSHNSARGRITEAEIVQSKTTDGLIFINTRNTTRKDVRETVSDLQQAGIPFVMINSAQDVEGINYVGVDDVAIGSEAGSYLLGKGRRRIALLASTTGSPTTAALRKGLSATLRECGLSLRAEHVVHGALEPERTLDAVERLLKTDPRPDAILCGSDLMAPELYTALRKHGLKVPDDVAVISRGDLIVARLLEPALTTFHFPHFEMGYRSASILVDSVRDRDGACQRVLLPTPLIERASA